MVLRTGQLALLSAVICSPVYGWSWNIISLRKETPDGIQRHPQTW
ncbi:MAG: hypothetical protein ACP5UZ_07740 [Thermoplasmata archaeon]